MGAGGKTRRLPESAWAKVLQRHLHGETAEAIARDLGCSVGAVMQVVRRFLPGAGEAIGDVGAVAGLADTDRVLASRLTGALIRFVETFEAARRRPDMAAADDLREASDQLMRAVARLRLEIERAAQERRL
jgi:hypothetical protein